MEWLHSRVGEYLMVSSAVYILWGALFFFNWLHPRQKNMRLAAWGAALAALSLQPLVQLIAGVSVIAACALLWCVMSVGAGLMVWGLHDGSPKNIGPRKAAAVWVSATAVALAGLLAAQGSSALSVWLASVFLLQGVFMAAGTALHILRCMKTGQLPVQIAFLAFSATSVCFSLSLFLSGSLGRIFSELALLNALFLSTTMTCVLIVAETAGARVAKARLELVMQAADAYEYSKDGRTLSAPGWFRALGYDCDTMDILGFEEIVHPQDRHKYSTQQAVGSPAPGATFASEGRFKSAGGGYVWFYVSSRNVPLNGRIVTLGMALDIDRHKRMERYAMQSDRLSAVGQLVNGVAHDINNHLMTMQTSLGLLGSVTDEAQRKKYSAYMREAIDNSSGMLKRLVSFSRGEDDKFAPVAMNELLAQSREMLERSMYREAQLTFVNEAGQDVVAGNYFELQNVILNIGLNARDALAEKGGRIDIRAWIQEHNPLKPGDFPGWYCVSIRDNGCGMSEDTQKRIFDPFFTTKPQGRGSGLGLFTAYGNIQRHSGTIHVESAPGAGTEFVVALPLMARSGISESAGEAGEQVS